MLIYHDAIANKQIPFFIFLTGNVLYTNVKYKLFIMYYCDM